MTVRFGIQGSGPLVGGLPEPRIFRDVATLAEDLGFDSLWAGEHLSFRNAILETRRYGAQHVVFNPAVPPGRVPEQPGLLAELRVGGDLP